MISPTKNFNPPSVSSAMGDDAANNTSGLSNLFLGTSSQSCRFLHHNHTHQLTKSSRALPLLPSLRKKRHHSNHHNPHSSSHELLLKVPKSPFQDHCCIEDPSQEHCYIKGPSQENPNIIQLVVYKNPNKKHYTLLTNITFIHTGKKKCGWVNEFFILLFLVFLIFIILYFFILFLKFFWRLV